MAENTNESRGQKLNWAKFSWEVLKAVVIGVAAVFSFLAKQSSQQAQAQAQATLEQTKVQIEQRTVQSQLDIKAYELVERTLALPPAQRNLHGLSAAAIVNSLTQPPLQTALQSALLTVLTDPDVKRQLQEALQFDQDTTASSSKAGAGAPNDKQPSSSEGAGSTVAGFFLSEAWGQPAGGVLGGRRIDIFYCEASGAASATAQRKARAEAAFKALQGKGILARVRKLPTLVQARPGYQSFSDEVRFKASETEAAQELARIVGLGLPDSLNQSDLLGLSLFYCKG